MCGILEKSNVGRRRVMRRREFIAAAISALSAPPFRTYARNSTLRHKRVGVLIYSTLERDPNARALLEGFRELGYVDGQNISLEYRSAGGQPERLPALATD